MRVLSQLQLQVDRGEYLMRMTSSHPGRRPSYRLRQLPVSATHAAQRHVLPAKHYMERDARNSCERQTSVMSSDSASHVITVIIIAFRPSVRLFVPTIAAQELIIQDHKGRQT